MSLYTKYRPKDWDSVIGQEYIIQILRNSIRRNRVSHAYLFHGSRGTGKTTSARILAKAINCLDIQDGNPCHICSNCQAFDSDIMLDIIEIDAASNTGVDNIRELIERARFEPNQGLYKVYIIDEVHMLSSGAFNALLKTLEEPPIHVKFILATTEIEKVPETIRSRTLRFDFRKIHQEDIVKRIGHICKLESIDAEGEALSLIARSARGSLRDAITLLEQNIIDNEISTEHVRYSLSLIDDSLLEVIIEALVREDANTILTITETLREKHIQIRSLFDSLMYRLRDYMIQNIDNPIFSTYSEIISSLEEAYGKIRSIPDSMLLIEITLLKIVKRNARQNYEMPMKKGGNDENQQIPKKNLIPKKEQENTESIDITDDMNNNERITETVKGFPVFSYPMLINSLKGSHPALMTDLKTATFTLEDQKLILRFRNEWNYMRVNTQKVKNIIIETLSSLFGGDWQIECSLGSSDTLKQELEGVF